MDAGPPVSNAPDSSPGSYLVLDLQQIRNMRHSDNTPFAFFPFLPLSFAGACHVSAAFQRSVPGCPARSLRNADMPGDCVEGRPWWVRGGVFGFPVSAAWACSRRLEASSGPAFASEARRPFKVT